MFTDREYVRSFAALLAVAEVAVSEAWRRGTRPRRGYPGNCYKKAADYVLGHDARGVRLVHGVYGYGPVVGHAWVELPGDVAFDGVLQRFYTLAGYCAAVGARSLKSYTRAEAASWMSRTGHFGPWEDEAYGPEMRPAR
jgi:hypothetical protein